MPHVGDDTGETHAGGEADDSSSPAMHNASTSVGPNQNDAGRIPTTSAARCSAGLSTLASCASSRQPAQPEQDALIVQPSTSEPLSDFKRQRLAYEGEPHAGRSAATSPKCQEVRLPPGGPANAEEDGGKARDVVLRIEWAKSAELKVLTLLLVALVIAGIGVTTYMKVRAATAGTSWYLLRSEAPAFQDNLIAGCICVAVSGTMWVAYVARGLYLRLCRLRWEPRRRRMFLTRLAELTAIAISAACWTYAGDERRLARDCHSFNRTLLWTWTVRLTMANTVLCLWTITARGMTAWRGKPRSTLPRSKLKPKLYIPVHTACCSGACADASGSSSCGTGAVAEATGSAAAAVAEGMHEDAGQGSPRAEPGSVAIAVDGHRTSALTAPARVSIASDGKPTSEVKGRVEEHSKGKAAGDNVAAGASNPPSSQPAAPSPSPASLPMAHPPSLRVTPMRATTPTPFASLAAGAVCTFTATSSATDAAGAPLAAAPAPHPAPATSTLSQSSPAGKAFPGVCVPADCTPIANEPAPAFAFPEDVDTTREEQLYIDAPWWHYAAPFMWLWVPFECLVAANAVLMGRLMGWDRRQEECLAWFLECRTTDRASFIVLNVLLAAEVLYILVYFSHCLSAFIFLRSRSYVLYRQLNIFLSVEARIRGFALLFVVANDLVQALYVSKMDVPGVGRQRCRYSIDIILGNWSTQVVMVGLVCTLAWLFTPRSIHGKMPLMQATLQRFAWTEADLPRERIRRIADAPWHGNTSDNLLREPMFCFETALKLTYWCEHIYYYDEQGCEMRLPLEKLKELYGFEDVEVLREEESDAKAMIAWNTERCLICFRGTASLKAACIDLKAMLVPYYNRAALTHVFGLAPLAAVHHGFQSSWLQGGFNCRVVAWVRRYRERHPAGKITVTGHSLGGAHAMLCTMDVAHALGTSLHPQDISCYTFGAPRIGNHTFAALYDKVVNETWHVINGNDMVPLTPKYVGWFVYKHPGHKVIVKRRGDIIVRPSFTENAVLRLPGSRSLRHHLLGSHLRSMMAVLRQQTRGKHVEGGTRALLHLARYALPEVAGVHKALAQEVQAVTQAAVKAVGSMQERGAAPAHASRSGTAAAAAAAASKASHSGGIVFQSLLRHGSLRLLMGQGTSQLQQEQEPSGELQPRQLLAKLVRRVNLGMELMGVETGMEEEEPQRAASGGGMGSGENKRDAASGSGSQVDGELAAFQRAAAAQQRSKQKRRQAGRSSDWVARSPVPQQARSPVDNGGASNAGGAGGASPGLAARRRLFAIRRAGSGANSAYPYVAGAGQRAGRVSEASMTDGGQ